MNKYGKFFIASGPHIRTRGPFEKSDQSEIVGFPWKNDKSIYGSSPFCHYNLFLVPLLFFLS